jgi:hypothetical protein
MYVTLIEGIAYLPGTEGTHIVGREEAIFS